MKKLPLWASTVPENNAAPHHRREMTPDDGQVVLAKDKTLGYLAQNSTVDTSHTIYEELLSVKADLLRLEGKDPGMRKQYEAC